VRGGRGVCCSVLQCVAVRCIVYCVPLTCIRCTFIFYKSAVCVHMHCSNTHSCEYIHTQLVVHTYKCVDNQFYTYVYTYSYVQIIGLTLLRYLILSHPHHALNPSPCPNLQTLHHPYVFVRFSNLRRIIDASIMGLNIHMYIQM